MKDIVEAGREQAFSREVIQRAARSLPILRRPRELRGPWIWWLPQETEQVQVSYRCPLAECPIRRQGWMPFGLSRQLFIAGLVRYLVRGRLRRTRPGAESDFLLPLRGTVRKRE